MSSKIERKVEAVISPMQEFMRDETVSSGFLFAATLTALFLANSPWASDYLALWHTSLTLGVGEQRFHVELRHLINDGLMALFFLVLGLEIKRELLVGELRDARRSIPVLAAAAGGMLVPAAIYMLCNAGLPTARGWGIPMATDSAFALGVLLMLGARVPAGVKAFLVAFAIIDDLGAILVIALFYTDALDPSYLGETALCLGAMILCNIAGLRHIVIYLAIGVVLWACVVAAGVHGTVAGVLIAATVPARPRHGRDWFLRTTRQLTSRVEALHRERRDTGILGDPDQHATVEAVEKVAKSATTPLRRWERSLERPVLLLVLPLFALANAGIPVDGTLLATSLASPVAWGILLGLVLGKVLGIGLFTWLAIRLGSGRLPGDMGMRHVAGVALLGGMGFTMSVFIAGLTFADASHLNVAKLAILLASSVAGVSGYLWLRRAGQPA